jgi:hypothetical protein
VPEAVIPTAIRKLANPKFSAKISITRGLCEAEISSLKARSPKQYEIYSKIIKASSNRNEILKHCSSSAMRALVDNRIMKNSLNR